VALSNSTISGQFGSAQVICIPFIRHVELLKTTYIGSVQVSWGQISSFDRP